MRNAELKTDITSVAANETIEPRVKEEAQNAKRSAFGWFAEFARWLLGGSDFVVPLGMDAPGVPIHTSVVFAGGFPRETI